MRTRSQTGANLAKSPKAREVETQAVLAPTKPTNINKQCTQKPSGSSNSTTRRRKATRSDRNRRRQGNAPSAPDARPGPQPSEGGEATYTLPKETGHDNLVRLPTLASLNYLDSRGRINFDDRYVQKSQRTKPPGERHPRIIEAEKRGTCTPEFRAYWELFPPHVIMPTAGRGEERAFSDNPSTPERVRAERLENLLRGVMRWVNESPRRSPPSSPPTIPKPPFPPFPGV